MTLVANLTRVNRYRVGDMRKIIGAFSLTGVVIVADGWLACNGALASTTTFAVLFAEIGHAYNPSSPGTDPGGGNFFLPDGTNGRVFIPKGPSNFATRGGRGGAQTIALASDGSQDPNHAHTFFDRHAPRSGSGSFDLSTGHFGTHGGDITSNSGSTNSHPTGGAAQTHQNMPPARVIGGWKIRYKA